MIVAVVDDVGCLGLYHAPLSVMIFWRVGVFIVFVNLWFLSEEGVNVLAFQLSACL